MHLIPARHTLPLQARASLCPSANRSRTRLGASAVQGGMGVL